MMWMHNFIDFFSQKYFFSQREDGGFYRSVFVSLMLFVGKHIKKYIGKSYLLWFVYCFSISNVMWQWQHSHHAMRIRRFPCALQWGILPCHLIRYHSDPDEYIMDESTWGHCRCIYLCLLYHSWHCNEDTSSYCNHGNKSPIING